MPCFMKFANCFSILTLWLLGTSNKLVGEGVFSTQKYIFINVLYHHFALEVSITP
jgi:hypothetical protein